MSKNFYCFLVRNFVERFAGFGRYVDYTNGANVYAGTAGNALVDVDLGNEVFYLNSTCRTGLFALHAANAAFVADLAGSSTFLAVGTHYGGLVVYRQHYNNVVGANLSAGAAAGAFFPVDAGYAVFNDDGIEFADVFAVAVA